MTDWTENFDTETDGDTPDNWTLQTSGSGYLEIDDAGQAEFLRRCGTRVPNELVHAVTQRPIGGPFKRCGMLGPVVRHVGERFDRHKPFSIDMSRHGGTAGVRAVIGHPKLALRHRVAPPERQLIGFPEEQGAVTPRAT